MVHWGIAMTYFHQLWEPPITAGDLLRGRSELQQAAALPATSRERQFIAALQSYYQDSPSLLPSERARIYATAMARLAAGHRADPEAQIFYALALLAAASPFDKTHTNQKRALRILAPLFRRYPLHPGIAHYLIHATDNAELASKGLPAAQAYAQIAPSAPHALHMPSHIFTRLGRWRDSIESNQAARRAAAAAGDRGEELHAMDYLTYAYLQLGRRAEAAQLVAELQGKAPFDPTDFKIAYAATAMPVRFVVETERWPEATTLQPLPGTLPQVAAMVYWAQALGWAHLHRPKNAAAAAARLEGCWRQLQAQHNPYWAHQTHIQLLEVRAWTALAAGDTSQATELLRRAADEEDSAEKLPVTPGPIVPAREQLGRMLLLLKRPRQALTELEVALHNSPGRRSALLAAAQCAELTGNTIKARQFRMALSQ